MQGALGKFRQGARDGQCHMIYFDEATFCASPPVQRAWSPIGQTHRTEPAHHTKRAIIGALDYTAQKLHYGLFSQTIKRETVIDFLDRVLKQYDGSKPVFIVIDNARIHHNIPQETLDRWMTAHCAQLLYLPPYSPELNLIEIVWNKAKYHWRRFVTWTKDSFEAELHELLGGYGTRFQVDFS